MAELREKFVAAFRDVHNKRIQYYLDEGSQVVPAKLNELEWKDYCSDVYRFYIPRFYFVHVKTVKML